MKIHFFDDDPRKLTDKNYSLKMGSFGVIAYYMNKTLSDIGYYSDLS